MPAPGTTPGPCGYAAGPAERSRGARSGWAATRGARPGARSDRPADRRVPGTHTYRAFAATKWCAWRCAKWARAPSTVRAVASRNVGIAALRFAASGSPPAGRTSRTPMRVVAVTARSGNQRPGVRVRPDVAWTAGHKSSSLNTDARSGARDSPLTGAALAGCSRKCRRRRGRVSMRGRPRNGRSGRRTRGRLNRGVRFAVLRR